jgi:acylphosphatase
MKRLNATVFGRVQGVSFRYYTRQEAEGLTLTGWVRNERDGSVSVVAEGSEEALSSLLNFLHSGPVAARVSKVESNWSPSNGKYKGFEIRWL